MTTLQDTLTSTIQVGYYRQGSSDKYIKFSRFGSINCRATFYDSQGNTIETDVPLLIDGLNSREEFELVPESELPEKLRT